MTTQHAIPGLSFTAIDLETANGGVKALVELFADEAMNLHGYEKTTETGFPALQDCRGQGEVTHCIVQPGPRTTAENLGTK